jgi:hypothetical protein
VMNIKLVTKNNQERNNFTLCIIWHSAIVTPDRIRAVCRGTKS